MPPKRRKSKDNSEPPAKRPKKPKKRPTKAVKLDDLEVKLKTLSHPIAGVDLSLSNPGLAILDPTDHTIRLYFFRNRKLEVAHARSAVSDGPFRGWTVETHCWEVVTPATDTSCERFARYGPIIDQLISQIGSTDVCGIEHYSLGSSGPQSSSQSMLFELGGCFRYELFQKVRQLSELAPTMVKKMFTDNGHATKDDMYKAYKDIYRLPCLMQMLGLHREYEHVPNPVNDLVDALAVAICTLCAQG